VLPPHLDVAGFDLEKLSEFLMSDGAPENCMQLSDLDGFLTAVAIGPELIMPSEWLPVIWGESEPEFENMDGARRIIGTIMGRYNEILQAIQYEPDAYEPLFWETRDGQLLAADWAEGFMDGVGLLGVRCSRPMRAAISWLPSSPSCTTKTATLWLKVIPTSWRSFAGSPPT
jgi:uncharacterized protein